MSTQTPISPLKKVQFMQTSNPTVCGLQLTDFKDKQLTAGVDAGGLAFVTTALLEQARHPAFAAASAEANEQPALCSVAGDALTFAAGRSAEELAVMLTIGSVEVAVHLPRTEVERAIAALRAAD